MASEADPGKEDVVVSWQTRVSQWIGHLSGPEQQMLSALWFLRGRRDAVKKLEDLFHADAVQGFLAKMETLRFSLGSMFAREDQTFLSTLFIYMVSAIPDAVREEVKQLVDAALSGRPIARGS